MAFETINLGTQPAGTGGDTARSAFEKTNRNFLAAEVLSAAMSQAQFEAIRAQNKEKYAASGWVSFGNHESGKQVNECKPGLYTSITTPNTLLIGKAGGVGGSKTDHASVHIDGVVFNLTNQFVLTLPSHPTSTLPERMDMYGVESEKVEISAASPNAYQGGLRGVGAAVNLFTATDQQKKDFFSANANTTYIGTDGKIYQWQLYKISFAGTTDGVPSPSEQSYSRNTLGDLWLKAGKNLLYFGDVLRLNNGGYHPSFNPLGAAKFVGETFWHNTAASITSKADCFDPTKILAGSGSIATAKSGRPDGRYYDAIYADGQGGVCRDMRYSAYGVDAVDFAEADQRVKNGTYRGFENLYFTKAYLDKSVYLNASALQFDIGATGAGLNISIGDSIFAVSANGAILKAENITNVRYINCVLVSGSVSTGTALYSFFVIKKINFSIGGSFLQTDVMGHPANIIANPHLANGWPGNWIPVIPNGTSKSFPFTRKYLGGSWYRTFTTDNGGSWVSQSNQSFDVVTNSHSSALASNGVMICQYQAFAKQTENAINAVVYGANDGVGHVYVSSNYQEHGNLLAESLIGRIPANDFSGVRINSLRLLTDAIQNTVVEANKGKLSSATVFGGIAHQQLSLSAPSNNSPAVKALNYNVNINQQAFIQYAYTELKHNGTNWGDDGKVAIVDNNSTKPDDNGNIVSVGTAKLKEQIGWIKKVV